MFLLLDEVYLMDIFFFHLGMNIQETMKQWDMTRHTVIIYFWVFDRMVKISLSKVYNKFNTKIWFFFCFLLHSVRLSVLLLAWLRLGSFSLYSITAFRIYIEVTNKDLNY